MTTLYLTEPGTVVRYRNESLLVTKKQEIQNCRLAELDLVIVLPGVQLTDVAIAKLIDQGIETIFLRQDCQLVIISITASCLTGSSLTIYVFQQSESQLNNSLVA